MSESHSRNVVSGVVSSLLSISTPIVTGVSRRTFVCLLRVSLGVWITLGPVTPVGNYPDLQKVLVLVCLTSPNVFIFNV